MKNEAALFFRDNDKKSGLTPNKKKPPCGGFLLFRTIECGFDRDYVSFLVEGEAVDAHFAMSSRNATSEFAVNIVFIDAVVNDVPFVFSRNLKDGVVGSAVDFVCRFLLDNHVVVGIDGDRTEWRLACAVAYMIVRTACVVNRPEEVVCAFAIEHIWSFAICPCLQCASLWSHVSDGLFLY